MMSLTIRNLVIINERLSTEKFKTRNDEVIKVDHANTAKYQKPTIKIIISFILYITYYYISLVYANSFFVSS